MSMENAYEVRRQNLLNLLANYSTNSQFADRCDLAPAHVSQMKTGRRDMGDQVARRVEDQLSLGHGWMDHNHAADTALNAQATDGVLDTRVLRQILDLIDDKERQGRLKHADNNHIAEVIAESYPKLLQELRVTHGERVASIVNAAIAQSGVKGDDVGFPDESESDSER